MKKKFQNYQNEWFTLSLLFSLNGQLRKDFFFFFKSPLSLSSTGAEKNHRGVKTSDKVGEPHVPRLCTQPPSHGVGVSFPSPLPPSVGPKSSCWRMGDAEGCSRRGLIPSSRISQGQDKQARGLLLRSPTTLPHPVVPRGPWSCSSQRRWQTPRWLWQEWAFRCWFFSLSISYFDI